MAVAAVAPPALATTYPSPGMCNQGMSISGAHAATCFGNQGANCPDRSQVPAGTASLHSPFSAQH